MDSLYSAFFVESKYEQMGQWRPFDYGRSQAITQSDQLATAAHTNVPRAMYAGLPMGWEMFVQRWRVVMGVRLQDPILDWASETEATVDYNGKRVATCHLVDLLLSAQPIDDGWHVHDWIGWVASTAGGCARITASKSSCEPTSPPRSVRSNAGSSSTLLRGV